MKQNLIKLLITLDVIAISITSIWVYNSKYDFEPIIVLVTLIAGYLSLLYNIKGDSGELGDIKPKSQQKQKGGKKNIQIGGDFNK